MDVPIGLGLTGERMVKVALVRPFLAGTLAHEIAAGLVQPVEDLEPLEGLDPVERRVPWRADLDPAEGSVGAAVMRALGARRPRRPDDADEGQARVDPMRPVDRDLVRTDVVLRRHGRSAGPLQGPRSSPADALRRGALAIRRIDAMLAFPHWLVNSDLMSNRRTAPSSDPPPRPARGSAKGPTREALLSALAGRERELAEAMARQTATSEILRVISQSPTDARPVFEEILGACQRLFGSDEIGVYTIGDDDMVRVAAWRGPRAEEVRHDVTPVAESITGRIIRERRTHHIPDLRAEPNLSPTVRERVDRLGGASLLYAPMLWEDCGTRLDPRGPFAAKTIHRPGAGAPAKLRRPGGDRDPERADVQVQARHAREALRQQTATSRYPSGHCCFARRFAAGARHAGGDSVPSLRSL